MQKQSHKFIIMKFTKKYKILFHDTDKNGLIYPSSLFVYLQETAQMHIASLGSSSESMHENDGEGFWLTRICLDMTGEIHAYDEIEVETWASSDSRGFSFNRCFRVLKDGEVVCNAYSVWVLMRLSDMKPIPVKDWHTEITRDNPVKPNAPLHLRIPAEVTLQKVGERSVLYSDIDINGHMNNTRYPNVIFDLLPTHGRLSELTINYLHEATEGEKLTLMCGEDADSVFYVRSLKEDGSTNIEARVKVLSAKTGII